MLLRALASPPVSPLPLSLKVLRILLALSLALTTLCAGLLCTTNAQADTAKYLDSVLGPLHIRVLWNLQDHEADYIGTPYVEWTPSDGDLDEDEGPWWSQGIPSPTGTVGMNDAGFIAHVIMQTGYSTNSFSTMNAWFANNAGTGTASRTGRWANIDTLFEILKSRAIYKTFSSKEEMLKSDYLQKCDIIIMKCDGNDSGGTDDYGRHHDCAHKSHVGIFYGEDSDDDVLWHSNDSYYGFRADEILTGNNLSRIQPSCWGSTYYVFKWQEMGRVFLWRTPNNTELVRNNNSYSFYDCWHNTSYKSDMSAINGIFPTHNITTDEQRYLAPSPVSGCAMPGVPSVGEMWMKGTSPGKGYVLDETIYHVNVKRYNSKPDQVTNAYSIVKTKYNPLSEMVSVYDADRKPSGNAAALSSGNATLQGAQFRVRFYDYQSDSYEEIRKRSVKRQWIFQTDPTGKVTLTSDNSTFTVTQPNGLKQALNYQLSGNALFTQPDGTPILSLGTYLITPYKASEGYRFEDENAYSLQQINDESYDVEILDLFEAPSFAQTVIRGGVHISVEDADYVDKNHLEGLAGAQYEIRNDSVEAVVVDGKTYQPGDTVATITTNDIGYAATDADALPYGTYSIKQTKAYPGGTLQDTTWTRFEIASDNMLTNPYQRAAVPSPVYGGIRLAVTDSQTSENAPQGDASFEDIAFEITNASDATLTINDVDYEPGAVVDTLYTNTLGIAETSSTALRQGTYALTPKNPPIGYEFSTTEPRLFTIEKADTLLDITADQPFTLNVIRGGITLERRDGENNTTTPQGNASLTGATYAITNQSAHPVLVHDTLCNPGDAVTTLTIDGEGASTFADTLPYGSYSISEATPSQGYYLSEEQKAFSIREQGQMHSEITGASAFHANVIKGGVSAFLQNDETQSGQTLGNTHLAGGQFRIINTSTYPVWVEGRSIGVGESCLTLSTDYSGNLQTAVDSLPVGSYRLELLCAPQGFERPLCNTFDFSVTSDGYTTATTPEANAINLSVIRSDLTLSKTSEEGPISHIPYRITSKTTGESHIIVTDENGNASTSAEHVLHSEKTNQNDSANADSYDPGAGIWFGAYGEGVSAVDDSRGALPYDTYLVEELPCPANEGSELDYIDNVSVSDRNLTQLTLTHPEATITKQPSLEVYPSYKSPDGTLPYTPEQSEIPITVTYEGLIPGQEYSITIRPQILVTADDGSTSSSPLCDPNGNPIILTQSFTPESEAGSFQIMVPTYGADLSQTTLVFFDELINAANPSLPLLSHQDASTLPGATISAHPLLSNRASESTTGAKVLWCAPGISITDVVGYYNLTPGLTYEARTSVLLRDPASGECREATDTEGNALTTSKTFAPETGQGILTTTTSLNTMDLAGYDLIVCEALYCEGQYITGTNDLQNPAQIVTVEAPHIEGCTTDASDRNHTLSPFAFTTLSDTVSYSGLIPGNEYTVKATVMIKNTATSPDDGEIVPLIQNEQPVQTEITFTPETTNGTLDLSLVFSTEALSGYTLIIYEDLLSAGTTIATNHNPQSSQQTLTVAARSFHSVARDSADLDSALSIGSNQKVSVSTDYRGLVPGETYSVVTIAMDAATQLPYQNALSESDYSSTIASCWNDLSAALHIQTDTDSVTRFTSTLESYYGTDPSLAWCQQSFTPDNSDGSFTCEVPVTTLNAPHSQLQFYVYVFHNANSLLTAFENVDDKELTLSIVRPTLQATYVDKYDLDRRLVAEQQRQLQCDLSWQSLEFAEGYTLVTVALDAKSNLPVDTAEDHTQRCGRSLKAHEGSQAAWTLLAPDSEGSTMPSCTLDVLQATLAFKDEASSQAWMFTPLTISDGTSEAQSITVDFDASSLEGKQIKFATYVFNAQGALCSYDTTALETLPSFEILAPSITTKTETPGIDGKTFTMSETTTFSDTVSFNNLGANLTYTLVTILMDQNTGLPARTITNPDDALHLDEPLSWSLLTDMRNLESGTDGDTQLTQARAVAATINTQAGTTICFESTFTPESESGHIKPEFTTDTIGLQNDGIVVYEYLFAPDGSLRTYHGDLQDGGSALYVSRPFLAAEVSDALDDNRVISPQPDAQIAHRITVRGLEPHATYELVSTIMDKTTQSPLTLNGIEQEKSVSFTPDTADSALTVDFSLDASTLHGQDLVLFATLYRNGKVVTSLRGYEDPRQTILVRNPGEPETPPQDDPSSTDDPSQEPSDPGASDKDTSGDTSSGDTDNANPTPDNPSSSTPGDDSGNGATNNPGNSSGNQSGNQSGNSSGSSNNGAGQTPDDNQKNPNAFLSATTNDPNGPSSSGPEGLSPQDSPASSQDQTNADYKGGYYAKTGRNLTMLLVAFGLCSAGCAIAFVLGMRNIRRSKATQK